MLNRSPATSTDLDSLLHDADEGDARAIPSRVERIEIGCGN